MKSILTLIIFVICSVTYANSAANPAQQSDNLKIHAVVTSETTATLASPMAGYIDKLNIKDGSNFQKGKVLVEFDCKIEKAELQKAKAEVKLSKTNKDSYARLSRLGSASKVKVAESQAQYEKAVADEKIATKKVSDCEIKAPFNGQVTELFVHQHETMQLHQKLFTILANDSIVVKVLIPSDWLPWIKIGTKFQFYARETNKSYQVKIERLINQVDAVSRSVKLLGVVEGNYPNLKSGMSGEATFSKQ